jgi:hypothetical protein
VLSTNKTKKKSGSSSSGKPKMLYIKGPWGSQIGLPLGRLPVVLGSDKELSPNRTVYPVLRSLSAPIIPFQTVVTAGAVAQVLTINPQSLIKNFASRFGALFDEYCTVGLDLEFRVVTVGVPQGSVKVILDEKNAAAPTNAVLDQPSLDMVLTTTESPSRYHLKWKAQDYNDLVWTSTTVTFTPCYVKLFASNADTLTGATTTANIAVTGSLAMDFRGYV